MINKYNILSWYFCSYLCIYSSNWCDFMFSRHCPAIREREKMESNEHGFLEELLALRRDTWDSIPIPTEMNQNFPGGGSGNWSYGCFDENPTTIFPNSFSSATIQQDFNYNNLNEVYCSFGDQFSISAAPELTDSSSMNTIDTHTPPFRVQDEIPLSLMELGDEDFQNCFKVEPIPESPEIIPNFNMGIINCLEKKSRSKKLDGQPSKNLMAERRRRKRLNDRLAMLRSIVPKISKMDRTSILADTIDYMKELLDKISNLKQEIETGANHLDTAVFKDAKPNGIQVRNSPKFDVERRNTDTQIDIRCAGKPGLLLSTVTSLETLGLEIQQCVISCFNDFSMQASCSEEMEQKEMASSEDIKQALFRNAGYGGRCL